MTARSQTIIDFWEENAQEAPDLITTIISRIVGKKLPEAEFSNGYYILFEPTTGIPAKTLFGIYVSIKKNTTLYILRHLNNVKISYTHQGSRE